MTDSESAGAPQVLQAFLANYEQQLGVPEGFIGGLLNEPDDWSFVLKLHGLLEGAVNKKLLELLGRPALEKPFRYVSMRTLISMADSLEAISKSTNSFLLALGELRNALVHTVAHVGFKIEGWATDTANASAKNRLLGPNATAGFAVAPPFNPYRFVMWGYALTAMAELQGATVTQAQGVSALIDAEVERRGQLKARAQLDALMKLLAEGSQSSDLGMTP
jgi:hypothetical protein